MKAPHILALAILVCLAPGAKSASDTEPKVVKYTYDASGNRLTRASISQAKSPAAARDSVSNPFENIHVTATPNPTPGIVTVQLSGMGNPEELPLGLYSLEGTNILQENILESIQLDLTPYPAGWYIVKIHIGDTLKSIKILKI